MLLEHIALNVLGKASYFATRSASMRTEVECTEEVFFKSVL